MKAAICEKYGPAAEVLRVGEVERPQPKPDQLLISVKTSAVTAADYRIRSLDVPVGFSLLMRMTFGFSGPRCRVLGLDFSGVVEEVGDKAEGFAVGDAVFGTTGTHMGCHSEYVAVSAKSAVLSKPECISFEAAAVFPFGYLTALAFLRDQAKLESGQSVLIYGASGSVGTASVQLAQALGATVTGVCSGRNVELVKSLGAEAVIDYQLQSMETVADRFDVVFDTVGKLGFQDGTRITKKGGTLLMAVAGLPEYLKILKSKFGGGPKVSAGMAGEKKADLEYLTNLYAAGSLRPVIDRSFQLQEIVAAHEYVESGRKRGNVSLLID